MSAFHVVPDAKGHWRLRKSSKRFTVGIFETEQEAWSVALVKAREQETTAYRHDRSGRICERADFLETMRS